MAVIYSLSCDLVSDKARLGYGKVFSSTKDDQGSETHDQFDQRCWRERIHTDSDGNAFIPMAAIKKMLEGAATYLGKKIPGKGPSTYAKRFRAGIMVLDDAVVINPKTGKPWKAKDVPSERLYVPSDGKVGGSTRVFRTFPYIEKGLWRLHIKIYVLDPDITEEVLKEHLAAGGLFGGLGRYRPSSSSGGNYGRFTTENVIIGDKARKVSTTYVAPEDDEDEDADEDDLVAIGADDIEE